MEQTPPATALPWRVLGAWADLRGAMRAEIDQVPSEGRLLFYLVLSQIVWLIGRLMALTFGPLGPAYSSDDLASAASGQVASLFFRLLLMYGVAALGHGLARAFGGTGGWRDSRAALFWAALVAAPAMLAATLLSLLASGLTPWAGPSVGMLGNVAFAWVLAQCMAEAHGFARGWKVMVAICILAGLVIGLSYLVIAASAPVQAEPVAGLAGVAREMS